MPKMSGFELKNCITKDLEIIFTTAHSNFALEAFNNNISDYLVKPISLQRLEQAIVKVLKIVNAKKSEHLTISLDSNNQYIIIRHKNKNHKIFLNDLLFVESKDEYVCYNTTTEKIIEYARLKNIENVLPKSNFIRIHKSYIVNKNQIKSYNKFFVQLLNGIEIPVGKMWREQFITEYINIQNNSISE